MKRIPGQAMKSDRLIICMHVCVRACMHVKLTDDAINWLHSSSTV